MLMLLTYNQASDHDFSQDANYHDWGDKLNTINIKFLVKLEKNTIDMSGNIQNTDLCVNPFKYSVIMCVSTTLCLTQILNTQQP